LRHARQNELTDQLWVLARHHHGDAPTEGVSNEDERTVSDFSQGRCDQFGVVSRSSGAVRRGRGAKSG
jgi:hypothetical protein